MSKAESWVLLLRQQVRSRTTTGWTVDAGRRGEMRLQVRQPGTTSEGKRHPAINLALPYQWRQEDVIDALARIQEIYRGVQAGLDVKAAAINAASRSSTTSQFDWSGLVEQFRQLKMGDHKISERTWAQNYAPRMKLLLELMGSEFPPGNATELLHRLGQLKPIGTRTREILVGHAAALLVFGRRQGLAAHWQPPEDLKPFIGPLVPKRQGVPIDDTDLLDLLAALPDTDAWRRWRFAIQVMAVTGCRPTEVAKLTVTEGRIWCSHSKRSGGGATAQRHLQLLPVRLPSGGATDFDVVQRLAAGEPLPAVAAGDIGEMLNRRIRYLPAWCELVERYRANGKRLVIGYCLRYRWIKAAHDHGIPVPYLAAAAGHSPQTALKVYARFSAEAETENAFAKAAQALRG